MPSTKLHRRLPLEAPQSIHIDPSNACNLKCAYCPTGDPALLAEVGRPAGIMGFNLFQKICDDLAEMTAGAAAPLDLVHLYKDGEPLLNPRLEEMIALAKSKRVARQIGTTTNGLLLTRERSKTIVASGLDRIRLSVKQKMHAGASDAPAGNQDYFEEAIENLRFLFEERSRQGSHLRIQLQVVDFGLLPETLAELRKKASSCADEFVYTNPIGWSLSGKKDFMLGRRPVRSMDNSTPLREVVVCPEPFGRLAINWNGSVSVCCVDWGWGTVVGDVSADSLMSIWNGSKLLEFRLEHLAGRRGEIGPCRDCQYVRGVPENANLDRFRARLLPLFGQPRHPRAGAV